MVSGDGKGNTLLSGERMSKAKIIVNGAWAVLKNAEQTHLEDCLAPMDPKAYFNAAFKEKRWDGRVRLYSGSSFPAGLTQTVVEHFNEIDSAVEVIGAVKLPQIDLTRFTVDYLAGIKLWGHQFEAASIMLTQATGLVRVPTGQGKTEIMCAVARMLWEEQGWRTLIIVPKKGILTQTVARFRKYYGDDVEVGQCGDGVKTIGVVTVATAQTLIQFKDEYRKRAGHKHKQLVRGNPAFKKLVAECEVLMMDEAHHTSSETWYEIAMKSQAVVRYGLSGTPIKGEEIKDMRLIGATGPVNYSVDMKDLVDNNLAPKAKIVMVMSDAASGPALPLMKKRIFKRKTKQFVVKDVEQPYGVAYQTGVVENVIHNTAVIRAALWLADHDRRVLVFCRRKDHFRTLKAMLEESGVAFESMWGDTPTWTRDEAKEQFSRGVTRILLATTIFDEGEDVPGIDALVYAEGVKSFVNAVQRLGRGMRMSRDEDGKVIEGCDLWMVDFVPVCHTVLHGHATERAKAYEAEGHEVFVLEDWPECGDTNFDDANLLPFLRWEAQLQETYDG